MQRPTTPDGDRIVKRVDIAIDKGSPVPMYHQVAEQLAGAIRSGELRPGDLLENEVTLAQRLGMSRPTLRHSIAELADRGLVVRKRGVGTTVAPAAVRRRDGLTSLFDELTEGELNPETSVLRLAYGEIDKRAALALQVDPSTPLVAIERLRRANGAPFALLRNWLPLPLRDLSVGELESDGLYAILRQRGITPILADQSVGASRPTAEERRWLGLGRSDAVLNMTRVAYDSDGSPVEFGDHSYRADRHRFEATVRSAAPVGAGR